ncbi:TPA: XRE family transcriptional regulator, partial [Candidatus Bipolaricaulota bacterium]|nr:XRE family transcriptional regulator [Candidatus Bipolaricaulota bacterium]
MAKNGKVLALEQAYANAYNEIVQPDRVFVASQYFRRKWVPLLGPSLAWLIIALRQRCYYNRETGELRDWCLVTQKELAEEIGVSRRTLQRLLRHPYAGWFIEEIQCEYHYNPRLKKQVRGASFYRVRMDDPLTPEDRELLQAKLADEAERLNLDVKQLTQMDFLELLDRNHRLGEPELPGTDLEAGGEKLSHGQGDLCAKMTHRSGDVSDKLSPISYMRQNGANRNSTSLVPTTTTKGADGEKTAAIWQQFRALSGAEREPSPKELNLLRELLAEGYTAEQICAAMEEVFAHFRPKFKGDRIQSFAYCVPHIRELRPAGADGGEFRRGMERAEELWRQINGTPPNTFEREELTKLAHRCDESARQSPYPELAASGGAGWVAAAIADAARAGSRFVAVRRVETIIERWMAEGPPWEPTRAPETTPAGREEDVPLPPPTAEDGHVGEVRTAQGMKPARALWQAALNELALRMTKAT